MAGKASAKAAIVTECDSASLVLVTFLRLPAVPSGLSMSKVSDHMGSLLLHLRSVGAVSPGKRCSTSLSWVPMMERARTALREMGERGRWVPCGGRGLLLCGVAVFGGLGLRLRVPGRLAWLCGPLGCGGCLGVRGMGASVLSVGRDGKAGR
jgi:hypothetical protein